MIDGKVQICRLCLKVVCNKNFEEIGENIKEMLNNLQLNLNLHISEDCAVCHNCTETINKCFDFKLICLNVENLIISSFNSKTKKKLDLREVYMQKNRHKTTVGIPEHRDVCRLCMKLKDGSCFMALIDIEINMLDECFPELDFNMTKDPKTCDSCLDYLKLYFHLQQTCTDTEEEINKFCKLKSLDNKDRIRLSEVLQFTLEHLGHESTTDSSVNFDSSSCANKEDIALKTEIKDENDNAQFDKEIEEYYAKTDVDESVVKVELNEDVIKMEDGELKTSCELKELQTMQRDFESVTSLDTPTDINIHKCDSCSYETRLRGYLTQHLRFHQNPQIKVYQCEKCTYKIISKKNLERHMLAHHIPLGTVDNQNKHQWTRPIRNLYTCAICAYQTKVKYCFTIHLTTHKSGLGMPIYKCKICPFETGSRNKLKLHTVEHQKSTKVKEYKCAQCSYKSRCKDSLKLHTLSHREISEIQPYKCELCAHRTKTKRGLKEHICVYHSQVKMYKCDVCAYETMYRRNLKQHTYTHHDSKNILKCNVCSFKAEYKSQLDSHKLVHAKTSESRTYMCDNCQFKSKYKCYLKRHMVVHQNGLQVMVFRCDRCPFETNRKDNFQRHVLAHKKKTFRCKLCAYETTLKKNLNIHILTHDESLELTMLKCEICSYRLKNKSLLGRHMLTHQKRSEATLYACDFCNFKTVHKRNVTKHMRVHRGLSR